MHCIIDRLLEIISYHKNEISKITMHILFSNLFWLVSTVKLFTAKLSTAKLA